MVIFKWYLEFKTDLKVLKELLKVIVYYSHFRPCNYLHSITVIKEMAYLQ